MLTSPLNIIIVNEEKKDSPLQEALRQKEEEKHLQKMSLLEEMLKRLERIPRSGTYHPGGTGC